MATDGKKRVMEVEPTGLHQRTPLFIGSKRMVEKVHAFMEEYDKDPISTT